jgi:hypothetical protein
MHPGRGAGGDGGPSYDTGFGKYIYFNGRISTGIQDLPGININYLAHGYMLLNFKMFW